MGFELVWENRTLDSPPLLREMKILTKTSLQNEKKHSYRKTSCTTDLWEKHIKSNLPLLVKTGNMKTNF